MVTGLVFVSLCTFGLLVTGVVEVCTPHVVGVGVLVQFGGGGDDSSVVSVLNEVIVQVLCTNFRRFSSSE